MPIRVLQVLGGLEAGGAESFVMNLYRKIDKRNVQFDFVKHITHKGVFEDEIHQMGGKIYQCPQYTGKITLHTVNGGTTFLKNTQNII